MSNQSVQGYFIISDPHQKQQGYYKVSKTTNINTTLVSLNAARALKDIELIKFYSCNDIKQLEDFIVKALKTRFINNSKEWIKTDEAGIAKVIVTIETLANIVNES